MSDTNNKDEQREPEGAPAKGDKPGDERAERRGVLREFGSKMPLGPGNFWNNMLSTVALLVVVTLIFSYVSESQEQPEELSLSQVVAQVKAGEVKEIIVRGAQLEIAYTDETRKLGEAKREVDASVTDSLTNLGVTTEELANITIDVQRETGFSYWLGQFAPFLFPLFFLGDRKSVV